MITTTPLESTNFIINTECTSRLREKNMNAAKRITEMFIELLECQFPINEDQPQLHLRSASDFAKQLNTHVNHLNRSVKGITEKTTSQLIAERVSIEAKCLLKQSRLNVSEIGYALGFTEAANFINFFKKHVEMSPMKFRKL